MTVSSALLQLDIADMSSKHTQKKKKKNSKAEGKKRYIKDGKEP